MWSHADRAFGEATAVGRDAPERRDALRRLRGSLAMLAMVAAGRPVTVLDRLDTLLKVRAKAGQGTFQGATRACNAGCSVLQLLFLPALDEFAEVAIATRGPLL